MICKVCSGTYRKGSLVYLQNERGSLIAMRVCPSCSKRAINVLPTSTQACKCGEPATVCKRCSRAKVKDARAKESTVDQVAIAKHLDSMARAMREGSTELSDFQEGNVSAFESAASIVRKWGAS